MMKTQQAISVRYGTLARKNTCLSCGGAIRYSDPKPGEICIDLGSGRGTDVFKLSDSVGERGFVYGIDISDGMLEESKTKAAEKGVVNVRFIKAGLEKLPLPGGTIDLVISNCTINHAEDKEGVWKEIFRVLKEGGRFVVSDIYSKTDVPEKYSTEPAAIAECWGGAVTKERYISMVIEAGLEDLTIHEESEPYRKGEIEVSSFTLSGRKPLISSRSE